MPENTLEATLQATIESLQKENAALKQENETLTEVNDGLTAKIEELASSKTIGEAVEKAAEAKKATLPKDTFEVGGKKYHFTSPVFNYAGQRTLAEDALQDPKLLASLVKAKSTVIAEATA